MKLHHQKLGKGEPLIILHGLFGSSDNWLSIARELSGDHTVYLLDQRNHGLSPHSASFEYTDLAADIREFMEDFSLKKATLLGHSMGGKSAMKFALDYPLKVRKLIVADIAPKAYRTRHDKIVEAMQALPVNEFSTRKQAEERLAAAIGDLQTVRFLLKNLARDEQGKFYWRLNIDGICANLQSIGAAIDGYNPYPGPALFIRGGISDYVSPGDLPEIRKQFPSAELQTLEGASHWLHVEQSKTFTERVRRFLAGPK